MQRDFYWNQADFHDINDYSKGSDGKSFQYIYLIKKIYCSEHIEASYQAEREWTKKYIFLYMVSPP